MTTVSCRVYSSLKGLTQHLEKKNLICYVKLEFNYGRLKKQKRSDLYVKLHEQIIYKYFNIHIDIVIIIIYIIERLTSGIGSSNMVTFSLIIFFSSSDIQLKMIKVYIYQYRSDTKDHQIQQELTKCFHSS